MATPKKIRGLYVIIDPDAYRDRSPIDAARDALSGGATVLQWRDKRRDKGDQIADARAIAQLCTERGALLLINDHADLVGATGAHGVHLGQHDLPLVAARKILGPYQIIGVSTNNADEARAAEAAGASYVAVGAIFPTESKNDTRPASLDRIREVKAAVSIPVVAIGGINGTNIGDVIEAGADSAAVISAVAGTEDVTAAAAELSAAFLPHHTLGARRRALRATIDKFVDNLNRRDREGFTTLFTLDGVIQDRADAIPHVGHEGIGVWWDALIKAQSNYEVRLDSAFIAGEEAAISWSIAHRHGSQSLTARGVQILSFEGDMISSCHSYWARDIQPETEALISEYSRVLNARERSAFLDLFARDAVQQDPVGFPARIGHASIAERWDEMMAAFPSFALTIDHTCVAGSEAAIVWRVELDVHGDRAEGGGISVIGLDGNGKIASLHGYWEAGDVIQTEGAGTQAVLESQEPIRDVVVRLIDILNDRDRDRFLNLVSPDCVIQVPSRVEPFVGRSGAGQWWDATLPPLDLKLRLDGMYVVGDDVVVVWSNHDRPPGSTSAVRGIDLLTIEGDRLSGVSAFRTPVDGEYSHQVAVAQALTDALNARDREAFLSLWAKDAVRQDPPDMIPIIGLEAIGEAFDEMLVEFPDYTMSIETVCVSGNEAAIAWTENRAGNAPPVLTGVVIIELDAGGKIASLHAYWGA